MSPQVLSPSDLSLARSGGRVRVGGRIRRSPGANPASDTAAWLCDAYGSWPLALASGAALDATMTRPSVDDGDLVVVDATWASGALIDAAIVSRFTATGAIDGGIDGNDVARFSETGIGLALRARSRALAAVRGYFERLDFLEVETPSIAVCPGLDTHLDAFRVEVTSGPGYLITSPEYQMKRLLVGGIPRCFQIAKSFRRGEIGARHNPEFTMLEWYRAFGEVDEVVADSEALMLAVESAVASPRSRLRGLDLRPPFPRLSVARAFEIHANISEADVVAIAAEDPETFYRLLIERVEPALACASTPIVLDRYPASMASLARLCDDDPRFAERFELYACGVELCNGFGELTDPREQRRRFVRDQQQRAAEGKEVYPLDERFLAALERGMPPSAGNALGLDRLIMLALGEDELAAIMAFPVGLL